MSVKTSSVRLPRGQVQARVALAMRFHRLTPESSPALVRKTAEEAAKLIKATPQKARGYINFFFRGIETDPDFIKNKAAQADVKIGPSRSKSKAKPAAEKIAA